MEIFNEVNFVICFFHLGSIGLIVRNLNRKLSQFAETSTVRLQRVKNIEDKRIVGRFEKNELDKVSVFKITARIFSFSKSFQTTKSFKQNEMNAKMPKKLESFVNKVFRFWVFNWMLCLYCGCGFVIIAVNNVTHGFQS